MFTLISRRSAYGSATTWLLIANIFTFLVVWVGGIGSQWLGVPSEWKLLWARPWTLLTYMFVHFRIWHLGINLLWLWMFSRILESEISNTAIWKIYITGGLAGALLYVICLSAADQHSVLIGASASVTALMGAAGVIAPNIYLNFFLIGQIRLKWVVLAGVLILFLGAGGGGFVAHIGGLCAGLSTLWWRRLPKLHLSISRYRAQSSAKRKARNLKKVIEKRKRDMRRLDSLLDQVRLSGFDSLSQAEQHELKSLSETLSSTDIKTL